MSNHLTNRLISPKPLALNMKRSPRTAILVLLMMLNSGCLGAIDDLDDIDDDIIDPILDWLEGEYPQLDLPTRERTSPVLDISTPSIGSAPTSRENENIGALTPT